MFLEYTQTKIKQGKTVTTEFAWITDIKITDKNAEKLAMAGRSRWEIENQGFNRQKRWQGNVEHVCSYQEKIYLRAICRAYQSTKLSIAKEAVDGKRKFKKYP